jgi:hypothetical protein
MDKIATLYYLENPMTGISFLTSEEHLQGESEVVKDVFGISYVEDIPAMLCNNQKFRESVRKHYKLRKNRVLLKHIFRRATIDDLVNLLNYITNDFIRSITQDDSDEDAEVTPFPPPFSKLIRLEDGIYQWDYERGCYEKVEVIYRLG